MSAKQVAIGGIVVVCICLLATGISFFFVELGELAKKEMREIAREERAAPWPERALSDPLARSALITRVVDGDTVDADIDLGLDVHMRARIRVRGIDTPELNSSDPAEREKALKAKKFVEEAVLGKQVVLRLSGKGKYGRLLADIEYEGKSLVKELLDSGLGKPYE